MKLHGTNPTPPDELSPETDICVHDWRHRPPLRLSPPRRLGIGWCWVNCNNYMCAHAAVIAIVPYVIRWGPDGWRDMLRKNGRCSKCGKKGSHSNVRAGAAMTSGGHPCRSAAWHRCRPAKAAMIDPFPRSLFYTGVWSEILSAILLTGRGSGRGGISALGHNLGGPDSFTESRGRIFLARASVPAL
jgi:hypothetical protein